MSSDVRRKLTTILAADAEGYSRVMASDEAHALGALRASRRVFTQSIERHHGRIANTAGDGLIAEFPSVVEAVQCAVEVQRELAGLAPKVALRFRIGVHLGDVMIDGDDLLGEGVNLAARLQSMAEPGGVLISQQVYDQVQKKLSVEFEYLGEKRPKNFPEDVAVYRISSGDAPLDGDRRQPSTRARRTPRDPTPVADDLRQRVLRHATLLGTIWVLLLVVDLATGGPFWAQWPGIGMAALVALEASPLLVRGWFKTQYARSMVIIGTLALINLFTWNGYPWALWPAGGIIFIELVRQFWDRPR
jgi:adenylate cyclase